MKSFEQASQQKQTIPDTELHETQGLQPEKALEEEKGVLRKFQGKAKKIAGVLMLMSALSAAPGLVNEAYAEQKQSTKVEHVEKKEIKEEFVFKQFKDGTPPWSKFDGGPNQSEHSFKMEFVGDVRQVLEQQHVQFDENDGSFILMKAGKVDPSNPNQVINPTFIRFLETGGEWTERVEVKSPGANLLIIKSLNSNGTEDQVFLQGGKIIGNSSTVK